MSDPRPPVHSQTTPYGPVRSWLNRPKFDYRNDPIISARPRWRRELYRIIFEHDTPAGKFFDVALMIAIIASVIVVMVESIDEVAGRHGTALRAAEIGFTAVFTIEYVFRLLSARRAGRYARSFFGVVDLLSILPTYLAVIVPGGQALAIIRILRVIRVFRVLKLAQFVGSEQLMLRALRASGYKIIVFVLTVLSVVMVIGSLMYFVEGPESDFRNIPVAVYWAIVTVTTVGFGDITPQTGLGQTLAALLMLIGYGIIAVPTGIVTAEMVGAARTPIGPDRADSAPTDPVRACPKCGERSHLGGARHCHACGTSLDSPPEAGSR